MRVPGSAATWRVRMCSVTLPDGRVIGAIEYDEELDEASVAGLPTVSDLPPSGTGAHWDRRGW